MKLKLPVKCIYLQNLYVQNEHNSEHWDKICQSDNCETKYIVCNISQCDNDVT